tara:strand:- start:436 stop:1590 length:1155 start_codon:yes stop_codon:yes gene_type:complete
MSIKLQQHNNFLTNQECDQLIEISRGKLVASTAGIDGESKIDESRISETYSLCDCSSLEKKVKTLIAATLNVPRDHVEAIQIQKYKKGGKFTQHFDAFDGDNLNRFGLASGNRISTAMVWLNDDCKGGETAFPNLGITYEPIKGNAITWEHLDSEGKINEMSLHEGKEVTDGEKWIITGWARQKKWDPSLDNRLWNEYTLKSKLPQIEQYTEFGYEIIDCPQSVLDLANQVVENEAPIVENLSKEFLPSGVTKLYSMDKYPALKDQIAQIFSAHCSEWAGLPLMNTSVYGIREYGRGSRLLAHRDRQQLVISATTTLDYDKPWDIEIEDNDGNMIPISLKPGQTLLYEGALKLHSRNTTFRGNYYRNFYCHFKPVTSNAKAKFI